MLTLSKVWEWVKLVIGEEEVMFKMGVRRGLKLACVVLTIFSFVLLTVPTGAMAQTVQAAPAAAAGAAGAGAATGLSTLAIVGIVAGVVVVGAAIAAAVSDDDDTPAAHAHTATAHH